MNNSQKNITLLTILAAISMIVGVGLLVAVACSVSLRVGVFAVGIVCVSFGRFVWALAHVEADNYSNTIDE